jgi:Tol biopolymer transport system component/lysophospholipase L1-like esterase
MKRKLALVLCFLAVLGIASAGFYVWAKHYRLATPCDGGNFTLLCMGDSITAEGYPEILMRLLQQKGFKNLCVKNLGRRGDTSGEYLTYLSTHPEVLKGRIDMVLLQLGTNDVRIDHDHTTTQTFEKNMRKIVETIRKSHPDTRIFMATIPPVLKETPGYFDTTSRHRIASEINPFIVRLARKMACTRIDVYDAFKEHSEWFSEDGIHPNKTGIKKLAEVYFKAIQPALSRIFGIIHFTLPPDFHEKVVFQSDVDGDTEIYLLTRKGVQKLTSNTIPDEYPVFSPDGTRILYMTKPGKTWKLNLYIPGKKTSVVAVDLQDKNAYYPAWCPDGESIVFATDIWGKSELVLYNLKTKKIKRITDTMGKNSLPDCSPDGQTVVFTGNRGLGWHIYKVGLKTGKIEKLTHKRGNCRPHYSPDGKWVAFVSESNGKSDIFLMHPDGSNIHSLTKDPRHWEYYPTWSRDSKRVYFSKSVKHRGAPWHLWVIHSDGSHSFQITGGFSQDRFADVF